jgi:hypothetical protein
MRAAAAKFGRLLSAAEYDAIVDAADAKQSTNIAYGAVATIKNLFGGLAEWTTTKYDFPGQVRDRDHIARLNSMYVLKGYGDPGNFSGVLHSAEGLLIAPPDSDSPMIGFRAVRSGRPRFVKP